MKSIARLHVRRPHREPRSLVRESRGGVAIARADATGERRMKRAVRGPRQPDEVRLPPGDDVAEGENERRREPGLRLDHAQGIVGRAGRKVRRRVDRGGHAASDPDRGRATAHAHGNPAREEQPAGVEVVGGKVEQHDLVAQREIRAAHPRAQGAAHPHGVQRGEAEPSLVRAALDVDRSAVGAVHRGGSRFQADHLGGGRDRQKSSEQQTPALQDHVTLPPAPPRRASARG